MKPNQSGNARPSAAVALARRVGPAARAARGGGAAGGRLGARTAREGTLVRGAALHARTLLRFLHHAHASAAVSGVYFTVTLDSRV
jgi:hypothetical protein